MLRAIGEGAVSSIDTGNADVAECVELLRAHSRKLQLRGWWFNTDYNYTLTPDGNSNLILPSNTLKVDASLEYRYKNVTMRGLKLYDVEEHTLIFTEDMDVDLITGQAWDDLPQSAREYIVSAAGLEFVDTDVGSELRHVFTKQRKDDAMLTLLNEETENSDFNMLKDSASGRDLVNRRL